MSKQNTGPYPGGPMETHPKSPAMISGAAGGEGGKPASTSLANGFGGTGASGLGGEVGKAISSIMDMGENVETFAKKVAYAGLYGATGGQGQPGSLEDAIKDSNSLSDLGKKFSEQVDRMNDLEAILKDFNECQTTLDLVLNKTNAVNAYFAFMQGKRLLKLQGIRSQQNSRDWIKWITGKLPNLKKRSREKYMSLASVPGVENHLEYGVERLAEFGTLYSSKSDEEKAQLGPDPFMTYMKELNVNMDSSYDERRDYIDAVLEVSKLERIGLEFDLEVMASFLRAQDPLTGEERKHLKKLGKEEAVKLLNRIIAKELKRKNLIAGTDSPPPSEGNSQDASTDASSPLLVTGPNIEKQVVTLCKSLESVTSQGIKLDSTVDRDSLVKLKGYIDQLLAMNPDATA